MSNSEEKMLILKMLEEGKITSAEAERLLSALEGNTQQSSNSGANKNQKQTNFQDEAAKIKEKINDWKKEFKKNYNQKDFDHMVDDFSSKAEKLGKNVANTTAGIFDKVVDFVGSFVDTNAFNIFGSFKLEERSFEALAEEGMTINIEGTNGHIIVKKHAEDKIVIKSKVRSPQNSADQILVFSNIDKQLSLTLNNINNSSVSHEVFLPVVKYGKVKFETKNARIYIEDLLATELESSTKNSGIDLMGVTSDKAVISTKNAKIQLSYVIGNLMDVSTQNAPIEIKNLKASDFRASTTNSKILVENAQNLDQVAELNLVLKTTNAGIKVNMNDMDNRGYKVKGQTSNGNINLLIPEITYHNVNKHAHGVSFIEADSIGYENYAQKVNISAETTNGFIEIVK